MKRNISVEDFRPFLQVPPLETNDPPLKRNIECPSMENEENVKKPTKNIVSSKWSLFSDVRLSILLQQISTDTSNAHRIEPLNKTQEITTLITKRIESIRNPIPKIPKNKNVLDGLEAFSRRRNDRNNLNHLSGQIKFKK